MIRKIGVLAAVLSIVGSSVVAKIEGKVSRDTMDSGGWLPIGFSLIAYSMQVPTVEHSICGVMFNVGYGKMGNVYPLEVGLFNQVLETWAAFRPASQISRRIFTACRLDS